MDNYYKLYEYRKGHKNHGKGKSSCVKPSFLNGFKWIRRWVEIDFNYSRTILTTQSMIRHPSSSQTSETNPIRFPDMYTCLSAHSMETNRCNEYSWILDTRVLNYVVYSFSLFTRVVNRTHSCFAQWKYNESLTHWNNKD